MKGGLRMKNNFVRLQTIVGEQLGIESSQIKPDSDFTKELGADSLDVVELIMVIEDEFEIEIDDKVASKIGTVQDALNYIEGSWDKI
jgi:acyl carrier protein